MSEKTSVSRGKSKWLTFEYVLAMVSTVLATLISVLFIHKLTEIWRTGVVGGFIGNLATSPVTQTQSMVAIALLSVMLAVLSFVLFGRVSKKIVEDRPEYTQTTLYKVTTHAPVFALLLVALLVVSSLLSVLLNSLLMIGVGDAGQTYGALYLGEFLPGLVSLVVLGAVIFFLAKIVNGTNASKLLSIILIVVTSVVFLATAITMTVRAHDSKSSTSSQLESMLKNFNTTNKFKNNYQLPSSDNNYED